MLQQMPVGGRFERVAIDIMGELPVTENGNRYVLVLSDYFTKWTQAFPIPNQTAATVADTLMTHCFSLLGMPQWIHSDQGSNFESELFAELCRLLDIQKTRTLAYHPQSDGQVERFNRTVKQMIKAFIGENMSDWDDHLPYLLMAYRATPHDSTGLSPNLLMFGQECELPLDVMVKPPPRQEQYQRCRTEYVEWLRQSLGKAHAFARQNLEKAAQHQKLYYDRKVRPLRFAVGQFVWFWYDPLAARKFGSGWTGPFRVTACPTETHCVVEKTPGGETRRVHVNKLKPHVGRIPAGWAQSSAVPSESDSSEGEAGSGRGEEAPGSPVRQSNSDPNPAIPTPGADQTLPPAVASPVPAADVLREPGKRKVRRPKRLDL
jgi:hypothetical protein